MATKYIVLANHGAVDGKAWVIEGHAEASGPIQARKKVSEQPRQYLIVPMRNATFESVSVETPEPKTTSVLVAVDTYLDQQPTLPIEEALGAEVDGEFAAKIEDEAPAAA